MKLEFNEIVELEKTELVGEYYITKFDVSLMYGTNEYSYTIHAEKHEESDVWEIEIEEVHRNGDSDDIYHEMSIQEDNFAEECAFKYLASIDTHNPSYDIDEWQEHHLRTI